MCLLGMSLAERALQVLFLLVSDTLNLCCTDIAQGPARYVYAVAITKIPARSLCSLFYPDTCKPKHSNSPKVNASKGKRRIWENTLSTITVILTRDTKGWRKRAKWRNRNAKHMELFWKLVVESSALHFKGVY